MKMQFCTQYSAEWWVSSFSFFFLSFPSLGICFPSNTPGRLGVGIIVRFFDFLMCLSFQISMRKHDRWGNVSEKEQKWYQHLLVIILVNYILFLEVPDRLSKNNYQVFAKRMFINLVVLVLVLVVFKDTKEFMGTKKLWVTWVMHLLDSKLRNTSLHPKKTIFVYSCTWRRQFLSNRTCTIVSLCSSLWWVHFSRAVLYVTVYLIEIFLFIFFFFWWWWCVFICVFLCCCFCVCVACVFSSSFFFFFCLFLCWFFKLVW